MNGKWKMDKSLKKTFVSKVSAIGFDKHWSNSFHLLAKADGKGFEDRN
jgi:hypothetical protein